MHRSTKSPPAGPTTDTLAPIALALCLVLAQSVPGASAPPQLSSPIPETALDAAHAYSAACGGCSLLVEEAGRLRLERYDNGWSRGRHGPALSITKNIAALACLVAQQEGILDLDEPASDTLPEWRDDGRKRTITLRQLLTQTSGLREGSRVLYERKIIDKNRAAVALGTVSAPGTYFEYGPSHYEALAQVLARKLARRGIALVSYLDRRILDPIDASSEKWRLDQSSHLYLSTGASLQARELLHLGRLILDHGSYRGRPIVTAENIDTALRPSRANPLYGLSFWLNRNASRRDTREINVEQTIEKTPPFRAWSECCLSRTAPPDLVAMIGSHGQRVYVVPSRGLVIARQGVGERFRDTDFLRILFSAPSTAG